MNDHVLITGGSRGIGAATVLEFARAGYDVAFTWNSREDAALDVVQQAQALNPGGRFVALHADVSDSAQVNAAVQEALQQFGSLQALICCAGIAQQKLFTDLTDEDWHRMMGVDLDGVSYACRAVLPGMIRQKYGRLLLVSSMWGQTGGSCEVRYSAAKAGVIGLTKALAKEEGPSGITVNCVAPGVIETDMMASFTAEDKAALAEETPVERLGTPEEVARTLVFLAGLRVGAYYYTYARTESAVAGELTTFLNALEGLQLEYPVFVDVEASSLTSLGKPQLTNLVKYAMDILNQRKWYAGWYSYTNYINSYMNASALANYPLWVADYRSSLGYTGQYGMWQYSGSGTVSGITGAVDLDYSYQDYLPTIRAGNFNGYGSDGPDMTAVSGYKLTVFGSNTEYFYTANLNDVVGYLPLGSYPVTQITKEKYNGYDWVVFEYNGGQYWTALIGDRNRLERDDTTDDCSRQLAEANAKIAAAKAALE